MLKNIESTFPEICQHCWGGVFDPDYAVLTYRGPWLDHKEVLCDKRNMYDCLTVDGEGHCVCDGFVKLEDVNEDTCTTTYDGVHHSVQEVAIISSLPKQWDKLVIEALKKDECLAPKMELMWSAMLHISVIPSLQFGVKLNQVHRIMSLATKIELSANRKEWIEARNEIFDLLSHVEEIEAPLAAVFRRQLAEYICGRSQARVAQGHSCDVGDIQIHAIKDPLLKQMLGGSWCGVNYICLEGIHTKRIPSLNQAAYVDACGSTLNSWSSIHRDLSTSTSNNAVHYYGGKGMSQDLLDILYSSIYLDGPGVRSSLNLLDLNDQTSRYKFTENYWHCRAVSYCPLAKTTTPISQRLSPIYGPRSDTTNTHADIFNYIFTRQTQPSPRHFNSHYDALQHSMQTCLTHRNIQHDYTTLHSYAQTMLHLQSQLHQVSENKDHQQITLLSQEYRKLKMKIWSRELKEELPIGSALVLTYIFACWFMENMDNVDAGYQKLWETKYEFPA
ncbi:hypothetical protein DSO57_1027571 [Entomophthora muscae]|uniref:Uncharacterized protein n=1 Tax=Entomophthora muscae TaxID=34485 RepID=A0ACC2SQR5_9FUNG|nr:hypothetical protein DSO57_1027571 [Entomophthora muscae]